MIMTAERAFSCLDMSDSLTKVILIISCSIASSRCVREGLASSRSGQLLRRLDICRVSIVRRVLRHENETSRKVISICLIQSQTIGWECTNGPSLVGPRTGSRSDPNYRRSSCCSMVSEAQHRASQSFVERGLFDSHQDR